MHAVHTLSGSNNQRTTPFVSFWNVFRFLLPAAIILTALTLAGCDGLPLSEDDDTASSGSGQTTADDGSVSGTYTSSGTYDYDDADGVLTLNTTSSNFTACGPEVGEDTFTVDSISETEMVWDDGMTWTRSGGTAGDIVGTWTMSEGPNDYAIAFNSDGTYSLEATLEDCQDDDGDGDGGGDAGPDGDPDNPTQLTVGQTHIGYIEAFGTNFYRFTATTAGFYTISVGNNPASDVSWELYSDSAFSSWLSDCDNYADSTTESCSTSDEDTTLTAGTEYYLVVDEWDSEEGELSIMITAEGGGGGGGGGGGAPTDAGVCPDAADIGTPATVAVNTFCTASLPIGEFINFYQFTVGATGPLEISLTNTSGDLFWQLFSLSTWINMLSECVYGGSAGDVVCITPSLDNGTTYYLWIERGIGMASDYTLTIAGLAAAAGAADVTGEVVDATTGYALSGVTVTAAAEGISTTTDSYGDFTLTGVSAGSPIIHFHLAGYIDQDEAVDVTDGVEADMGTVSMSPAVASGQIRMVLTWGQSPSDLDFHALTPSGEHIYFGRRTGTGINLDRDDTSSYGPETITITSQASGTYTIYVYQWSSTGSLSSSGATVELYDDTGLIQTVRVPSGSTDRYWNVLTINSSTYTVVNTMSTSAPTGALINASQIRAEGEGGK